MVSSGEKELACVRGYHVYICMGSSDWRRAGVRLADTIVADGRFADRDPLGSDSPLMGFN